MSGCDACEGPVERFHHPTGRDEGGVYLDSGFTRPLCHDHHELTHDQWKTLELEVVRDRLPFFERVEIRLRRWAATLMVIDGGTGVSAFGLLATFLVAWAEELAMGTKRLDERDPTWREDDGFYPE